MPSISGVTGTPLCLLKVDSVKNSMKNRDNVRFVPMVKHIMQECCHFQWTSSALSNVTFTFDF